jgi:hypothetical protein
MTTQLAIDTRRESGPSTWGELAPAAVLPAQLSPAFRLDAGRHPEKRLMLAVLEEAVASYQKLSCATAPYPRREFLEAQSWIESDDVQWPFSFCNICDALGLDGGAVRRGLRAWRDRQRALPAALRTRIRHPFRRTNGTRTRTRGRAPGIRIVD